jgi:FixJ family two-component response regulator
MNRATQPSPPMHGETIFIVDDDASVRDALSLMLSLHKHATATFASAEDFLAAFEPTWRGCVIADVRMAGMSGLGLQALLREQGVALPFIVITAHGNVAAARQAFLADAVDFLEKPFEGEALIAAVEAALVAGRAADKAAHPKRSRVPAPLAGRGREALLSPREQEVMTLLVQGMDNRRIAETLGISHRTVEVHKARVLDKLEVHSVVDLVRSVQRPDAGSAG